MRTRMLALAVASLTLSACTGDLPTENGLSTSGNAVLHSSTGHACHAGTTARALEVRSLLLNSVVAQAGPLGCTGEDDQYIVNSSYVGVYSADALRAQAQGTNNRSDATASLANLDLTVGGVRITAKLVESFAQVTCTFPGIARSGGSLITDLYVNGIAIDARSTTEIQVGPVRIRANEQLQTPHGITVNALRITADGIADVVVSSSKAEISCG